MRYSARITIAMTFLLATSAGSALAVTCQELGYTSVSAMLVDTKTWTGNCAPLGQSTNAGNVILPRDTAGRVAFKRFGWVGGPVLAGEPVHCDRSWVDQSDSNVHWYHADYLARCGNPADITFYVRGVPIETVVEYRDREVTRRIIVLREREVARTVTVEKAPCVTNNYYTTCAAPPPMPMVTPMVTYGGMRYPGSYSSGPPTTLVGLVKSGWKWVKDRVCPPPEDNTCGPGTPGVEPPPNGGTPGNPSGPIPCPPATDPNRPPDQATHGTSGQPWDPAPDAPTVADPIN